MIVVAALMTGFSALAAPAEARNNPIAASPSVRQTVAQAPASVTLAMKEAVKGPAVISVTGPDGKVVSQPTTTILATNIAVDLNTGLARGTYTVKYRIEGPKGPEGGTYQFAYGSGTFSVKDISMWDGYREIPKPLRLDGDDEREKASVTPSTESTPTAEPSDDVPTSEEDTKGASNAYSTPGGWIFWPVAAAAALLAATGAAIFVRRRRRVHTVDTDAP